MTSSLPGHTGADRVAEIRARLDAATPGPWSRFGRNSANEDGDDHFLGHDIDGPPEAQRGQFERVADAELIAHAPADLAHLLSLIAAAAEIHKPFEYRGDRFFCSDCSDLGGDGSRGGIEWPCETALALGLDGGGPQ